MTDAFWLMLEGTRWESEDDFLRHFSSEVANRSRNTPPPSAFPPAAQCIHDFSDEWPGIYGFGIRVLEDVQIAGESVSTEQTPVITLDYSWLQSDLRRTGAREPYIRAIYAEFALENLFGPLGLEVPDSFVLTTSTIPQPFSVGEGVYWPDGAHPSNSGTIGPVVKRKADGSMVYLTAGHVPQHDQSSDPKRASVEIDPRPFQLGKVLERCVPSHTSHSSPIAGEIDAALIAVDPAPASGIGAGTLGKPRSAVAKVGGRPGTAGRIVGYDLWTASKLGGLWRDSYTIEPQRKGKRDPFFAVEGDSGAAVKAGNEVIGIVVGGAAQIPGCQESFTYVQNIESIAQEMGLSVVP